MWMDYDNRWCGNDQTQDNDGIENRKKRNETKLLFPPVKYVEPDKLRTPILSLKNFKIARKFSISRFVKALIC